MRSVYTETGQEFRVDPHNPTAEGGEALIFDVGGGEALKLYRQHDDPFLVIPGDAATTKRNQEGAKRRIAIHQTKLPSFPKKVPERVVGPSRLVWDKPPKGGKPTGMITGFIMPFVKGNVLADFSDIDWREIQSIDNNQVRDIFLDWIGTMELAHAADLVF